MRYYYPPLIAPVFNLERSVKEWSISRILFFIGTALVTLILLAMTIVTYRIATNYLQRAYARNAQTRTMGQAHALNQCLQDARDEILYLAKSEHSPDEIRAYMLNKPQALRNRYREIAFHGNSGEESFVLLNTGEEFWQLPKDKEGAIKFPAFSRQKRQESMKEDFVQIEQPAQVYYPSIPFRDSTNNFEFSVLRLTTHAFDKEGRLIGLITLSIDLHALQNIMAVYSSEQSPLYIFPQDKIKTRSFFFDSNGWLLFESEFTENASSKLAIDSLRSGLQGDIGRPGYDSAFRPNGNHEKYWIMVTSVQSGKPGQLAMGSFFSEPDASDNDLFLNYAPITFAETPASPVVIGGIGCMDTSFLFKAASYEIIMTLGIAILCAILLTLATIYYLHRRIARPLVNLTLATEKRALGDDLGHLDLASLPRELRHMQHIINVLLLQLQASRNELSIRQGMILDELQRQPVNLDDLVAQCHLLDQMQIKEPMNGMVGGSQAIRSLRSMIQKAASVMADVLVIGETGTGKELTAEAIHKASSRSKGPFISINCGALDENLLLDALFGHIKGAFSEAKGDRQGAFIAASGGTLHLDEIGNASPKVQQALLRALSVRHIRPLGSDTDIPFNARVIAATNVELLESSKTGAFREDLYYRLAVITINTPPLRERKEDIPALVRYFLKETAQAQQRTPLELSRGALDKLMQHNWPGNIREMKNCITRAVTFAEQDILQAEHVHLGSIMEQGTIAQDSSPQPTLGRTSETDAGQTLPEPPTKPLPASAAMSDTTMEQLNQRQRKAWAAIITAGGTNRAQYQEAIAEEISVRTAQYDLQDLVNKGLLIKIGRGPSSHYTIAPHLI